MTAYTRLPVLLHRMDTLISGRECASPGCYAEAYRWLSPYCQPACPPRVGLQGPSPNPEAFAAEVERTRHQIAETFGVPPALLESRSGAEIQLVGGPFDGRVMTLQEPLDVLVMPVPPPGPVVAYWTEEGALAESGPWTRLTYHRCSLSVATSRWRYVLGSHDACLTASARLH